MHKTSCAKPSTINPEWGGGDTRKKPGVLLVNKLRAILLMEADFNFGNKLYIGSRMTKQVHQDIPRELYGGVKGRRVEFMALSRRLLSDVLRQKRCPGAMASVDAQSCYDRITHSTASLCCQRWGVPHRILETMLLSIQKMKFYLRTGYGESKHAYGGGDANFQGICQGNGAGPAVWLAISAVLVLLLREKSQSHSIRGALTPASLVIIALLFVDDTDLFVMGQPYGEESLLRLLQRLQRMMNVWQGLLQASGGSLSADKCSWTLVAFRWNAGKWSYHTSKTLPADMYITQDDGQAQLPIRRIDPAEAIVSVGVAQAMDGSMTGQIDLLSQAINKWSDALSRGPIPRHIAWTAIRSKIWPSIRFPLSTTTITQQQGRHMMGKLYKVLLPKLGSNRNIPASVRYGPLDMAGLDLPEPYTYQGSQQVSLFHQLYSTDTNEGHLLRVSLEHLQLEVGVGTPILLTDFGILGHLATSSWLKSLWEFAWRYDIRLELDSPPIPPLCRERDKFIMDLLVSCPHLTKEEIRAANRCRLYLQLVVISDMATGGGDSVLDKAFSVQRDLSRTSRFEWQEERPSTRDIAMWQKCLSLVLAHQPMNLGVWIAEPHYFTIWWYDELSDTLYKWSHGKWWCYTRSESRHTRALSALGQRYKLSGVRTFSTRPIQWARTTVREYSDGRVSHEGYYRSTILTPSGITSDQNTPPILGHLPASSGSSLLEEVFPHSIFPHNGWFLAKAIERGSAHGASDGSYMPARSTRLGTAAWIMEDSHQPGVDMCSGTTVTSGWRPEDVNAYRSELQGIYSVLLALRELSRVHKITTGSFELYCDNEKAVYLSSPATLLSTDTAHIDLLTSIRTIQRALPCIVKITHVRGHQDDLCHVDHLPRSSQLNIACDNMAKSRLHSILALDCGQQPPDGPIVGEGPRCFLRGEKLVSHIAKRVSDHCLQQMTQAYLIEKGVLSPTTMNDVNWSALGRHLRNQSVPYRLWAAKHSYNFAATGRNMTKWGLTTSDACPCCGQNNETLLHLYQCSAPVMRTCLTQGIEGLRTWMLSVDTHPDIIVAFSALSQQPPTFQTFATDRTASAATKQDNLGVWNSWVGRLSLSWELLQEEHYHSIGSARRSSIWAAGLVANILEIGHRLWTTRNNILHDRNLGGLSIHEAMDLRNAIQHEFSLGLSDLHPRDQHLITTRSLHDLLQLPVTHRRLWLQSIQVARDQGRLQRRTSDNSMSGIMRRWLGIP